MTARRTLSEETALLRGLGLFSGEEATVVIRPSLAATGILFTSPGRGPVAATVMRCVDWRPKNWPAGLPIRNTSIGVGSGAAGWSVGTVEHVMSALAGLGVTDAVVEVDGPEVPILDGSSLPFVEAMRGRVVEVDRQIEPLVLRRAVEVSDGSGGVVAATPRSQPGFTLTYELDYGPDSPLKAQQASWSGDVDEYVSQVAPARTFSMRREAEAARAAGLFKKFSASEMVVVGDDGGPIENQWRLEHEPARHKLLDLIGDLALLGRPVQADVIARKSGHALVREWCRAALKGV